MHADDSFQKERHVSSVDFMRYGSSPKEMVNHRPFVDRESCYRQKKQAGFVDSFLRCLCDVETDNCRVVLDRCRRCRYRSF